MLKEEKGVQIPEQEELNHLKLILKCLRPLCSDMLLNKMYNVIAQGK